jgi:cellulose synthase/poly-beta-1,6-N-acetylglucosamine synthase-like glycosyltransferase
MLRYFLRDQKRIKKTPDLPKTLPFVTIQLPLYNELYVVERLIACISKIKYPKDKLEIQVLDDSTDESLALSQKTVLQYQKQGVPIRHITRPTREGFKAGALKYGLESAKGEFIAIFDADFLPQSDWLLKTIPHFEDQKIGVVQTRWGHLNRSHSVLTEIQAFALDAHFLLEQIGRNQQNHFINFNGTAGIWRKRCILEAGNWEGDTLTEDLDLSYRAQLKQWKFHYLDEVVTPAELPVAMSAIRSQQFRWNKGGAENFRKMIAPVLQSSKLSFGTKFNACFHLLNSTMFLNVFLVSLLSIPILYIKSLYPEFKVVFHFSSLFILSTLIFFICYWYIHRYLFGGGLNSFMDYIKRFLLFYSLVMGFSVHNSIAVLEGHLGKKSAFIRTPKFNIKLEGNSKLKNKYLSKSRSIYTYIELIFSVYFLFGLYSAFQVSEQGDFGLFPFHLFLFIGFSSICYHGFKSSFD